MSDVIQLHGRGRHVAIAARTELGAQRAPDVAVPFERLRVIAAEVLRARNMVIDLLGLLNGARRDTHMCMSQSLFPECWESLNTDPGVYLFGLDFAVTPDWTTPRLVRTSPIWSLATQMAHIDPDFGSNLARYLGRRFNAAAHVDAPGILGVRTEELPLGKPESEGAIISRLAVRARLDCHWADLRSDWSEAPDLVGAWLQAPYVAAKMGLIEEIPEDLRLAAPRWCDLLDDPALMLHVAKAYQGDPLIGPADVAPRGRTIADQTGVPLDHVAGIAQPPLGGGQLLRFFVSDARIEGGMLIENPDLRYASAGRPARIVGQRSDSPR